MQKLIKPVHNHCSCLQTVFKENSGLLLDVESAWVAFNSVFINGLNGDSLSVKRTRMGTSLVVQWLRIRLPMQGTWVRALVQEDPTCHGATKPVRHNY